MPSPWNLLSYCMSNQYTSNQKSYQQLPVIDIKQYYGGFIDVNEKFIFTIQPTVSGYIITARLRYVNRGVAFKLENNNASGHYEVRHRGLTSNEYNEVVAIIKGMVEQRNSRSVHPGSPQMRRPGPSSLI